MSIKSTLKFKMTYKQIDLLINNEKPLDFSLFTCKIASLFLWLFLITSTIYAQNNSYQFSGMVIDAKSKEAIPFVHLSYSNTKGFTTNEQGRFSFYETTEAIKVKVSCVGYKSQVLEFTPGKNHVINLNSNTVKLNEIELVYINKEKELLKKVLENIPKNYPNENEKLTGIIYEGVFTDTAFKDTIYNANYQVAFNKQDYSKTRMEGNLSILQGEATIHKNKDSIPTIFYGVLHSVHSQDVVMSRKWPLTTKKLENLKLKIVDTLFLDNLKLLKLTFTGNNSQGSLLIDTNSYAIVKAEYFKKGKTSFLETLDGFERNDSYFTVNYEQYLDQKWRLKHLYFLGEYSKKVKDKNLKFYLKDHFVIRGYEPALKLISFNKTVGYGATGLLLEKVQPNIIYKSSANKTIMKKVGMYNVLKNINSEVAVGIFQTNINPYSVSFPFLQRPITKPVQEKEYAFTFNQNFFYNFKNNYRIKLGFSSSILDRSFSSYSLGIAKNAHLDPFGKFFVSIGVNLGYRRLFDNVGNYEIPSNLEINSKTFKKNEVTIYVGQEESFVSPEINITYKLSKRLTMNLGTQYFVTSNSMPSVLFRDASGFFRKSTFYNTEIIKSTSSRIITNKSTYSLGFVFGL